jgi:1-acyl-sn-glycerol-3-phosphate acyltransferase
MRTIVLCFVYVIYILVVLIPGLLICFLFRLKKPLFWIGKGGVWMAPKILGIRMEVQGRERFDRNKTYIFMPNHLSFLDGPLMLWLIPQNPRVIAKKQISRIPVFGIGMKYLEFIYVDRKGENSGKESIKKAVLLIREKGYSFLIFPEGTRSRDGRLRAFRRGGFYMALESGVPIVPVSIQGAYEIMPRRKFFVRRGRISVTFHKPVPVGAYSLETMPRLMKEVRDIILSGLNEAGEE